MSTYRDSGNDRRWFRLALSITAAVLLGGCSMDGPQVGNPSVSLASLTSPTLITQVADQPTLTISPTETLASTPTPSATPLATWTPVPLLTGLPADVAEDFLLFDNWIADCELPCWQSIIPGKTIGSEAQIILNDRLRTSSPLIYQLVENDPYIHQPFPDLDLSGKGYSWVIQEEPLIAVTVFVWYEQDGETVSGLEFKWISRAAYALTQQINPQRLLIELGAPDQAYAIIEGTESGNEGVLKLLFLYFEGIVYTADIHVPIEWEGSNGTAQVCLGGEQWNGANNAGSHSIYLTESFPENEDDYLPLQWFVVTNWIRHYHLQNFEEFAIVQLTTLAEMAQQAQPLCFDVDLRF